VTLNLRHFRKSILSHGESPRFTRVISLDTLVLELLIEAFALFTIGLDDQFEPIAVGHVSVVSLPRFRRSCHV